MIAELTAAIPLFVRAGDGAYGRLGDHRGFLKVDARSSGGALSLFEMDADRDSGVSPHIHRHEDETFYILWGRFTFQVGEQTIEAGPGDCVFAPRDLAHAWRCTSPGGGRALVMLTPGENFEAFAFELAERGIVPEDRAGTAQMVSLAAWYGIEMLPRAA